MGFDYLVAQLNWIDWGVLVVLLIFAAGGLARGFLFGVLDLAGLVVAVGVAELGYRQVAAALPELSAVPVPLATSAAFLGLFLVAAVVISVAIALLRRVVDPFIGFLGPVAILERGLGLLPGLVKGGVFATMLVVPFSLFPVLPGVTDAVEHSLIGSRLASLAVDAAPELEAVLGRPDAGGHPYPAPPKPDETIKLQLGSLGALAPDPAAEEQMLELLNRERAGAGLAPLALDRELRDVARRHSQEMFDLGYFSHTSPVTGSPADRIQRAGIEARLAGENLAFAPSVRIAHAGLMNSPGHRANILRPEFTRVGIGVIRSERQGRMFSQAFAG